MKEHKTVCCGDPCTCEEKTAYTVEVPSGDVAEAFQMAINRAIHDAWQEGYEQGLRDSFPPPDTEDKEAEALERRLKDDPLHKLYLANREAGIQHDGDFPDHCPLYCTKHNHEEMGG